MQLALLVTLLLSQNPESMQKLHALPFTEVEIRDAFWGPRIRKNSHKTLPHSIRECESTGRIANFAVAGGLEQGEFQGIYFNDSDVYKMLEGASYTLAGDRDPELEARIDEIIHKIASAQQPDGYLNSYYTLVAPEGRWSKLWDKHELYCAGHLFEAAVAHFRATGKRSLLDVAIKFADHIDRTFGPGKKRGVPGHEEIELALIKLWRVTGEERYLELARFFLDERGRERDERREYMQAHLPVREQTQIAGHAVRAMYLYSGVADLAGITREQTLADTMERIWRDVTERKMYVTGGIGPSARNEGFTVAYDLPNESAYAETCASIGMALWNHRLLLLHGEGRFADVLERVLYNGLLAGVSLDAEKFFYVNPLASRGAHHRKPWYGCACCPTNLVRFLPSLGGYVYAYSEDGIWVTLYVASKARVKLPSGQVELTQETRYPWSGEVELRVEPHEPAEFGLNLRIPGWCEGAGCKVNGVAVDASAVRDGYLQIRRRWNSGDRVELDLPMEIRRVQAHPRVEADRGRIALMRGPLVYCLEAADNGGRVRNLALPRTAALGARFDPERLGGVVVIEGEALIAASEQGNSLYRRVPAATTARMTAVPYFAWDNREPGEMLVWIPESLGLVQGILPPTAAAGARVSASFVHDRLEAVNDGMDPESSDDHGIPRFTWWPHKGTTEWLRLDFEKATRVSSTEVYWFDDRARGGGCRVPASWKLAYLDGEEWRPVQGVRRYPAARDRWNRVDFAPVETTGLKLSVELAKGFSGGVLEWRIP